jgi:hypothetical protein
MAQLCSSSSRLAVDAGKDGELETDDTLSLTDGEAGISGGCETAGVWGCGKVSGVGVWGCPLKAIETQPARLNEIATALKGFRNQ